MYKPHRGWRAWWVALATCLLQLTAVAQSLTTDEACRIGRQWLSVQYPQPVVRRGEEGVNAVRWRAVYRVQRGDGAFVLLHARTAAVMGYGRSGLRPMPEALHTALMQYGDLNGVVAEAEVRESYPVVPPLLQSVRGQSDPYNLSCPYYTTEEGTSTQRCLTGCVATALEQILTYYRQPAQLQDSLACMETPHYVVEGVPAGTPVDWAHVRDIYAEGAYSEAEARAVADLSLWCGMMAGMNWGLEASGAQIRPLEVAVRRVLGYKDVRYADSYRYTPADWERMMRTEIEAGRPVLYTGYTGLIQGHAFVLDGQDASGLFHVNWGYDGAYDGYFAWEILWPFGPVEEQNPENLGFYCNQEALLLCPDSVPAGTRPTEVARTGRELRVDSLRFLRQPDLNDYVTAQLTVTNTSLQALTTPLALYSAAEADTLDFEQAECVALGGVRLAAGATARVTLRCRFQTPGLRVLSLTPDDSIVIFRQTADVLRTPGAQLDFGNTVVQAAADSVVIIQPISNAVEAGWAGNEVVYSLFEGTQTLFNTDERLMRYLNLAPGCTLTDTVVFRHLKPSTQYTLWVRCPWNPVRQLTFTTSSAVGLSHVSAAPENETFYDVQGRRVRPRTSGIVISDKGRKILRSRN